MYVCVFLYLCSFVFVHLLDNEGGLSMVFVHKESVYMYYLYSYYICIWREAGGLLMVFVHKESSESSYSIYSIAVSYTHLTLPTIYSV